MKVFQRDRFSDVAVDLLRAFCLLGFGFAPAVISAELPEESSELVEKLAAFETSEKAKLDAVFAEKNETAATLLSGHLEEQRKSGDLDAALSIKAAIDSLRGGGSVAESAQLPEGSSVLLSKLEEFKSEKETEFETLLSEKRRAVVGLLSQQMKAKTKQGQIEQAVAINEAIQSLEENPALGGRKSGADAETGTLIPADAIEHAGVHYKAFVTRTSIEWDDAREECRKIGGRLAWFDSPSDEKLIRTLLEGVNEQVGHVPVWVGGLNDQDGNYFWLNGEPVDPGFWANEKDAAPNEQELFMARWIGSFKVYRKDHHRVIGYICRWE